METITITITSDSEHGSIDEQLFKLRCSLTSLHGKVDKMTTDITQLETVIEELGNETGLAVAELQELATEIEGLEVGSITQDQVDTLKDKAQASVEALTAGVKEVQERTAPVAEEPETTTPKPTKTVYVVNPEASLDGIDTSQYSTSGFVTSGEDPQTLYYFSGDTAESDANGANTAYSVYTDEAIAVAS